MKTYLIILGVIHLLNLGFTLAKDGEPTNEEHSFWKTFFMTALSWLIIIWCGLLDYL